MSPVELPFVTPVQAATPTLGLDRYAEVAHKVRILSWLSLAWMTPDHHLTLQRRARLLPSRLAPALEAMTARFLRLRFFLGGGCADDL